MKLRKLHTISALVMLAWIASLGWLVQREYLAAEAPGDVAASARVVPGSAFFAVFLPSGQVGVASTSVDTMAGEVRLSERFEVTLAHGDATRRWRLSVDTRLSPTLELRSLTSSTGGDLPASSLEAVRSVGDTVALELRRGSRVRTARKALPAVVPVGALPLRLAVRGRPRIGQMLEALVIDPLDGTAVRRQYVVADSSVMFVADSAQYDSARGRWTVAHGADVVSWRLDEVESAAPARIWVDAQGFVVRAVLPSGFWLQRTAFEIAQLNLRAGKGASARYNQDYRTTPTRLSGVTPADTAAELLVPSDAPTVRATASQAAGDAVGAEARARALLAWTSREIASRPADETPDALAALADRRAGEVARSLLYVALARAQGIPARVVSGARRDTSAGWVPRVWSEVHTDSWVAVDPVTGDWPADTSLVRLRTGGSGHPLELAGLVARLSPSTAAP
jgi:transglutaminase-like putative cysteine protease